MYTYENLADFLEHYDVFLRMKHLLYGYETYGRVNWVGPYEEFVDSLLTYTEAMGRVDRQTVNGKYRQYGGIEQMRDQLIEQLEVIQFDKKEQKERMSDETE